MIVSIYILMPITQYVYFEWLFFGFYSILCFQSMGFLSQIQPLYLLGPSYGHSNLWTFFRFRYFTSCSILNYSMHTIYRSAIRKFYIDADHWYFQKQGHKTELCSLQLIHHFNQIVSSYSLYAHSVCVCFPRLLLFIFLPFRQSIVPAYFIGERHALIECCLDAFVLTSTFCVDGVFPGDHAISQITVAFNSSLMHFWGLVFAYIRLGMLNRFVYIRV